MEERMTDELMLSLLRRLQEFQCIDGGKSSISITLHRDEDGMYFTYYGRVGDDSLSGECYYFRSYKINSYYLDKFIEFFSSHE